VGLWVVQLGGFVVDPGLPLEGCGAQWLELLYSEAWWRCGERKTRI